MKEFFIKNKNIIISSAFIAIVAILGSIFVNIGMDWFDSLLKPTQWIPNFIIPIVWTTIYLLFAIFIALLYKNNLINKRIVWLGIANGILNILWCLAFFTLQGLFLGNIIIIINTIFGVFLLVEITKINKCYLNWLWIYPIWLCIATTLNTAVWILN